MQARKSSLVIGGDSSLGAALATKLEKSGQNVWKTTRRLDHVGEKTIFLDLAHDILRWNLPSSKFDYVFICAAITAHKTCVSSPELAKLVNVTRTIEVAKKFLAKESFVVFLSSNAVFDGEKSLAKSSDSVNPTTVYGSQKVEVEKELLEIDKNVAIVRFTKVLSFNTPLLQDWMKSFKKDEKISPFLDMNFAPISLNFAVKVLCKIAEKQITGITQASGEKDVSYADFAFQMADILGMKKNLVSPISYKDMGILVAPRYTALHSESLLKIGLSAPSLSTTMKEVFS